MKNQCVIALSFGRKSLKSNYDPNGQIAKLAYGCNLPIIAQAEVAEYLKDSLLIDQNRYIDTWTALKMAKQIMSANSFERAVLATHLCHSKRARRQAIKIGIEISIPQNLPGTWDKFSEQWWTRNKRFWLLRETAIWPFLRISRRI